jgi:thiosulfate/3-mercaptopyruvate sulfurtransferase
MSFARPQHLVETDWLAQHLDDPNVRVLECTVYLTPKAGGGFVAESGLGKWREGHIPGSGFADLTSALSAKDAPPNLLYMMPPAAQFATEMGRLGVGDSVRVVLYDRAVNMWAARVWWMLRAFGWDNAAVLNGGWKKWTLEHRPVSTDEDKRAARRFIPHERPGLFVDKQAVLAGVGDKATCLINALSEEQHRGTGGVAYGRAGRITGSANVVARDLVDPKTHAYLPADQLRAQFEAVGALGAGRVITYCGGGIAASSDAFVLSLLGKEDVGIYDASLSEWARDPSLPMETG